MILPWTLTAWCGAGAALGLLALEPGILSAGYGHRALPSFVHLLTLGVVLSTHYARQAEGWLVCGTPASSFGLKDSRFVPAVIAPAIWGFHASGVALFALGLAGVDAPGMDPAYLGGHYLLPTAIALSIGAEIWLGGRKWRRGAPVSIRLRWPHLGRALGLLIAMSMGVMLLLDRGTGDYRIYGLPWIALHALAAAFLFVLPVLHPGGAEMRGAGAPDRAVRSAWPFLLAGFGLAAFALDETAFGAGLRGGVPLGLALLGAVALGVALPARGDWRDRGTLLSQLPWALFGLLLLHAAIKAWIGVSVAEALPLAGAIGAWFLLGAAAPRALALLGESLAHANGVQPAVSDGAARGARWAQGALLAGAACVLAAQAASWEPLVRAGALLWLGGWAALGGLWLRGLRRGRVQRLRRR